MEENYEDEFEAVTPSDQISEVPMLDIQGQNDSIFQIDENT
jgi:hypothetical protein